jgi:hypothetical protein
MTATGQWTCSISHPDGWVTLPATGTENPWPWAAERVREMLGPEAETAQVDALAADLVAWTQDSREREPTMALAFYPDPAGPLVAMCEIQDYHPDEMVGEITLDWLASTFGMAEGTLGEVETMKGDLPAGPAVRIRQMTEGAPDREGRRPVLETLTYGVRPPGIDAAVVLLFSWVGLALGAELTEMADEMAETLEINLSA